MVTGYAIILKLVQQVQKWPIKLVGGDEMWVRLREELNDGAFGKCN